MRRRWSRRWSKRHYRSSRGRGGRGRGNRSRRNNDFNYVFKSPLHLYPHLTHEGVACSLRLAGLAHRYEARDSNSRGGLRSRGTVHGGRGISAARTKEKYELEENQNVRGYEETTERTNEEKRDTTSERKDITSEHRKGNRSVECNE
jgi:hypothetical protein